MKIIEKKQIYYFSQKNKHTINNIIKCLEDIQVYLILEFQKNLL